MTTPFCVFIKNQNLPQIKIYVFIEYNIINITIIKFECKIYYHFDHLSTSIIYYSCDADVFFIVTLLKSGSFIVYSE